MTRRDANQLMVCERCLDKDFRYRLPILGEIVIAERTGRVGIIEIYELPVRWLCCVGIVQLQGIAPNRQEVLVVAFLQSGRQFIEGDTESAEALLRPLLGRQRLHVMEFAALCDAQITLSLAQKQREGARSWLSMWKQIDPDDPRVEAWERKLSKPDWRAQLFGR